LELPNILTVHSVSAMRDWISTLKEPKLTVGGSDFAAPPESFLNDSRSLDGLSSADSFKAALEDFSQEVGKFQDILSDILRNGERDWRLQ
jgi:hypothetical protein